VILHVVALRWKDGVSNDDVARLCNELITFRGRVDCLIDYRFGPDLGLRPGNADFGIVALVESPEALAAYLDHPAHQLLVKDVIAPMSASRTAVQITVEGALQVPDRHQA
jgi:hypothetical protein